MALQLKPGTRLHSAACSTELIVVRAPTAPVAVECGGVPMLTAKDQSVPLHALDPTHADGTLMGKRYADDEIGLELLCTKPGDGSLTIAGAPLMLKDAKPLPSSD